MRRSAQPREPPVSTANPADPNRPLEVERHSPGLEVALAAVRTRQSVRVLDLGPGVPANFEFLSVFCQHIRFVDLLGQGGPIPRLGEEVDGQELRHQARRLLPADWGTYDLVIVWDVINYLDQKRVESVVERLGALCRDGAVLFAMIATTGEIPAQPPTYTIIDRSSVLCSAATAGVVECLRRPPAAVGRLLFGFSVERSFILRHGCQEYVAIRR